MAFKSEGVKQSLFIFCVNACGLVPHILANSDTLILSETHNIFICFSTDIITPAFYADGCI